jgi:hypothetical protein
VNKNQFRKDFNNKTHQIVKNTLKKAEEFRKELKKDRQNLSYRKDSSIPEDWTPYQHYGRYVFPQYEKCLPITVSLKEVSYACNLMNIILLNLENDGFKVEFTDEKSSYQIKMSLLKDDEIVTIDLREGYSWQKIEDKIASEIYMRRIAIPNGNMSFSIKGNDYNTQHSFTSRHNKSIESQLDKIYQTILDSPAEQKRERVRKEKQNKEYEERMRIHTYNQSIIQSREEQYQIALKESSLYKKHIQLIDYLKVLKESAINLEGKDKLYSDLWFQLIEDRIEKSNPVLNRIQYFKELTQKEENQKEDDYYSFEADNDWCKEFIEKTS